LFPASMPRTRAVKIGCSAGKAASVTEPGMFLMRVIVQILQD
jgi:hypothetical protein